MNQNDQERYFWRTGQRWSVDERPFGTRRASRIGDRTLLILYGVLGVIVAVRLLLR